MPGIFVCHLGYCALSCLLTFLFTFLTCLLCLIPPDWSFFVIASKRVVSMTLIILLLLGQRSITIRSPENNAAKVHVFIFSNK